MLRQLFGGPQETRDVTFQSLWAAGGEVPTPMSPAGVAVNQETALRLGAVYACVRLIADTISTLPVDVFYRVDGERLPVRPRPVWLDRPAAADLNMSRQNHLQQVLVSLLLDGNAFVRVFRDQAGRVVDLAVLNPRQMQVRRNDQRIIEFVTSDGLLVGTDDDVLHLTEMLMPGELRGRSRVDHAKTTIGLGIALDEFAARFFGQGSITSGIIEWPGALTREQAKDLADSFEEGHKGLRRAHRPGVLFGGAKFTKVGVDPNEAQMIEARRSAVESIASLFRVPLFLLGVATPGAMSYASVEQNAIQFVTHTLRPYVSKLEAAYGRLLEQPDQFVRFNVDGLLRGDFSSRTAGYSTGLQGGWFSINDIRRLEDFPPVDGGDSYRVPLANIDVAATEAIELDKRATVAQKLVWSGYDPAEVLAAVGLPPIAHTGLPSTQLQPVMNVDPDQPGSVYP